MEEWEKNSNKNIECKDNDLSSNKQYENMTRKELYEEVKSKGCKGTSRYKKAQLLELLLKSGVDSTSQTAIPGKPATSDERTSTVEETAGGPLQSNDEEMLQADRMDSQKIPELKSKEPESVYVDWGYPLPDRYGIDRIGAAAKDPNWIFVNWDLSGSKRQEVAKTYGPDIFAASRWYLKVVDLSCNESVDFQINVDSNSWYVPVSEDKSFEIQIGIITPDGLFIQFAATSEIRTPRSQPAGNISEQWMMTDEYFQRFLKQAGDPEVSGMSSSDIAAYLKDKLSK
jgi:hypothetical protein